MSDAPDDSDSSEGPFRRTRSGAPVAGEAVADRFSADEVYQRIVAAADEEVTATTRELFFSGVAAGFAISITFLLYASLSAVSDSPVVGSLLYPLGFIYIIIGGYQLYTENTLPPVTLTLERLASVPALFRHWTVVLSGNFAGGAVGAAVLMWGDVFSPAAADKALEISRSGVATGWWTLFSKGVFAGLIVAGVVWVGFASRDTITRLVVVYLAFLAIPLGNLYHVVVSFTEALYLLFHGDLALVPGMAGFVLPVLLGNTIGGVVLVTLVNYFQTSEDRLESMRLEGATRRLTGMEWTLGRVVGRSYVPVLDTAEAALLDNDAYRVMVPITNPRTDRGLVEFAMDLAADNENATVHALHVVQVPESMSLISGHNTDRITRQSETQLDELRSSLDTEKAEFKTSTIATHRSFEEVFDAARRTRPDLVVMGWGDDQLWGAARAERPIAELTNQLPCDFLVSYTQEVDASRILLPTAGGPDSTLSAEVVRRLRSTVGSAVSLLHIVDSPGQRERGERFLREWADDHGLEDAALTVDDTGDVEAAIKREAEDATLLVIGATERGLIRRLVTQSLHLDIVNDVECSVLLAERPTKRSIRERLFGRGRQEQESPDG